jgi:hypothetical protein
MCCMVSQAKTKSIHTAKKNKNECIECMHASLCTHGLHAHKHHTRTRKKEKCTEQNGDEDQGEKKKTRRVTNTPHLARRGHKAFSVMSGAHRREIFQQLAQPGRCCLCVEEAAARFHRRYFLEMFFVLGEVVVPEVCILVQVLDCHGWKEALNCPWFFGCWDELADVL